MLYYKILSINIFFIEDNIQKAMTLDPNILWKAFLWSEEFFEERILRVLFSVVSTFIFLVSNKRREWKTTLSHYVFDYLWVNIRQLQKNSIKAKRRQDRVIL